MKIKIYKNFIIIANFVMSNIYFILKIMLFYDIFLKVLI